MVNLYCAGAIKCVVGANFGGFIKRYGMLLKLK